MIRATTFELHPDNFTLYVWDSEIDRSTIYHHEINDRTIGQGFSSLLGNQSLNFSTLGACMRLMIEVWYADESDEITVRDETIRAILVPFSLSSGWIKIGDSRGHIELTISSRFGNYALLFEIKLRDDEEYLKSSEYQENLRAGMTEEYCYLTFFRREELPEPEILRVDRDINPIYPLLKEVESIS